MMIHGWGSGGSGYRLLSLGNSRGARRSPQTIADGHPAWLAFWRLSCVVGGGGIATICRICDQWKSGRWALRTGQANSVEAIRMCSRLESGCDEDDGGSDRRQLEGQILI